MPRRRRRGAPAQAVLALAALGRVHGSPVAEAPFTNRLDAMGLSDANKPDIALIICGIYGAVILSFIGAVHWGLAMHGDRKPLWFVWSVIPALYAWQPVVFLDSRLALLTLVPGFMVTWSVDHHATAAGLLPTWYMRLRHMLTLGASIALTAASLAPPPHFHG